MHLFIYINKESKMWPFIMNGNNGSPSELLVHCLWDKFDSMLAALYINLCISEILHVCRFNTSFIKYTVKLFSSSVGVLKTVSLSLLHVNFNVRTIFSEFLPWRVNCFHLFLYPLLSSWFKQGMMYLIPKFYHFFFSLSLSY